MKRTSAPTDMWGELELGAYGAVRLFLQALSDDPRAKRRLNRLAKDAHEALWKVERAHKLAEIAEGAMEHP